MGENREAVAIVMLLKDDVDANLRASAKWPWPWTGRVGDEIESTRAVPRTAQNI